LFVSIARLAHPAVELDPAALLDDVRGLVRRRVKVGRARERDIVARGVRTSADLIGSGGGFASDVRANARDVVLAEARLDSILVRQRFA
jgi:hypothetical protein